MYWLRKEWNTRKDEVAPWWKENSKEAYATGCANLAAALANWSASKRGTRKGPVAGFPRFRSRHRSTPSCTFTTGTIRVEPDRRHVTLPVLGGIKTFESTRKLARRLEAGTARISTATITFVRGRWFVSFVAHVQRDLARPAHIQPGPSVVGVDVGVKDLIVVAPPDGVEVDRVPAPRPLRAAAAKLAGLQRKAARQRGPYDPGAKRRREPSAGWRATQKRIRKVHTRVANLRTDHLHKLTTTLAQQHQVIGVETLAVKAMTAAGGARKRGLNRALADASFGTLSRLLEYKTGWYGSHLVRAGRWYPSSKTCSGCGSVKTKLTLRERQYRCEGCGMVLDRDLNAAINLARLAQQASLGQGSAGSGPVVTGGADQKTTPRVAGGVETGTPAAPGTAQPQGQAA